MDLYFGCMLILESKRHTRTHFRFREENKDLLGFKNYLSGTKHKTIRASIRKVIIQKNRTSGSKLIEE